MLKRIKLFILLFIALLWFIILLPYFLVQTTFGTHYASQLISYYSNDYTISIGKISHSIIKPYEVELTDITIKNKTQTETFFSAEKVLLVLKKNYLLQPQSLDYLFIQNGYIGHSARLLSFDIDMLQLKNISTDYIVHIDDDKKITLNNISGRIVPWSTPLLNNNMDRQFTLTIANTNYNGIDIESIFLQGVQNNNKLELFNMGGDINHGFFTLKNTRLTDHTLEIGQLKINNINTEIQDSAIQELFKKTNNITVQQLSIVNSSMTTPQLSIEKGNLEANNIHYDGHLQLANSDVTFNAQRIVWHDELIENPLLQWHYDKDQIILEQLLASWHEGNIKLSGSWKKDKLTIDHIIADGLRYQLPLHWYWQVNSLPLSNIFPTDIVIKQLTLLPSLIIQTDPDLPFQFTAFEAFGSNIEINTRNNQFNVLGTLFMKADSGTLNTVELNKPDLILNLTPTNNQFQFSALVDQGVVDGSATLSSKQLSSFTLNAHTVDSDILSLWHLVDNPLKDNQYLIELHGDLQPLSLDRQWITDQNRYSIINNQLVDH